MSYLLRFEASFWRGFEAPHNKRIESLPAVARTALHGPNFVVTESAPHKAAAHAKR